MKQIINGAASQPCVNYVFKTIELAEAAAQSETLDVLRNAIRQHRELLERRYGFAAQSN